MKAIFRNNTYLTSIIGVDDTTFDSYYSGSFIHLINIMYAEFDSETFLDIGSFSIEQLNYTINAIKGVDSYSSFKSTIASTSRNLSYVGSCLKSFYSKGNGASLINITSMFYLDLKNSTFSKII